MFEVRDLRLIVAVAEQGSLTRAGLVLHLTQSALSHQLATLERRVGAPLFVRSSRRMDLTPVGERLRDSALEILGALERAARDMRAAAAGYEAALRLSTECYTCYHWLGPVLRAYAREHPRVEVRVALEATRRPWQALLQGKIELAIVSSAPRARTRAVMLPLFSDEMVAVVPPGHPWQGKRWVEPSDFARERLITYTVPRSDLDLFRRFLDPAGVTPREVSEVQLTEAAVELIKAGLGVGVLARWAVAPELAAGELIGVRVTPEGFHREWQAAVLRRTAHLPFIRSFVALLARTGRSHLASPAPSERPAGDLPSELVGRGG